MDEKPLKSARSLGNSQSIRKAPRTEAIDALGTVAGGAAGLAKVAAAVKAARGIGGVISGSAMAGKLGEAVQSAASAAVAKGDALTEQILHGYSQEPALATGHRTPKCVRSRKLFGRYEARSIQKRSEANQTE